MSPNTIASQLVTIGRRWSSDGHGLIWDRTLELMSDEKPRLLLSFLTDIERSMPASQLDGVVETLTRWIAQGGTLSPIQQTSEFQAFQSEDYVRRGRIREHLETANFESLLADYLSRADTQLEEPVPSNDEASLTRKEPSNSPLAVQPDTPRPSLPQNGIERRVPPPIPTDSIGLGPAPLQLQKPSFELDDQDRVNLPPALVIGTLVMCQALVLFFCLAR